MDVAADSLPSTMFCLQLLAACYIWSRVRDLELINRLTKISVIPEILKAILYTNRSLRLPLCFKKPVITINFYNQNNQNLTRSSNPSNDSDSPDNSYYSDTLNFSLCAISINILILQNRKRNYSGVQKKIHLHCSCVELNIRFVCPTR